MPKPKLLLLGDQELAEWHPLEAAHDALESILSEWSDLTVAEDYARLAELKPDEFDGVISYTDCWSRSIPSEQAAGLIRYVAAGGGLLALHNGISLQRSYELAQLLGGRFTGHPPYQPLSYRRTGEDHPLLEGVQDFELDEEPYRFEFDPFTPRRVLLEYDQDGERYPAAWEHPYGLGRVVYLQPGHHAASFLPASYRRLILNSVKWIAARSM